MTKRFRKVDRRGVRAVLVRNKYRIKIFNTINFKKSMHYNPFAYIHYIAPVEEQNFGTLITFLDAMEVREDDETFQNPIDQMFDVLEKKEPDHFAVRQYRLYKLEAGDICFK